MGFGMLQVQFAGTRAQAATESANRSVHPQSYAASAMTVP